MIHIHTYFVVFQVEIRTKKLDESNVVFVSKGKEDCAFDNHQIHEWDVIGHFMHEARTDPALSTTHKVYSTMYITIQAKRQPVYDSFYSFTINSL